MIRAHVSRQMAGFGLDIAIVRNLMADGEPMPGARQIMRLVPVLRDAQPFLATTWETLHPGEVTAPTLTLGDDEAIALFTALAAQYQGVDDQRMLRRDYDAERGRVDKLVDALVGIAQQQTAPYMPEALRPVAVRMAKPES